jgi:hypothetical protein
VFGSKAWSQDEEVAVGSCQGDYSPNGPWPQRRPLRLTRAAGERGAGGITRQSSDDQSRSILAGYQPKLLLARFDGQWYLPRGRAHSTHILKPRLEGRPEGLAREYHGHALAAGA